MEATATVRLIMNEHEADMMQRVLNDEAVIRAAENHGSLGGEVCLRASEALREALKGIGWTQKNTDT